MPTRIHTDIVERTRYRSVRSFQLGFLQVEFKIKTACHICWPYMTPQDLLIYYQTYLSFFRHYKPRVSSNPIH